MYQNLVALNVIDEESYKKYREGMIPILKAHGGGFNYDFRISEVLISQTENKINRVFTIYFPDKETSKKFFSSEEYLKVRKTYFDKAVDAVTIIAEIEK